MQENNLLEPVLRRFEEIFEDVLRKVLRKSLRKISLLNIMQPNKIFILIQKIPSIFFCYLLFSLSRMSFTIILEKQEKENSFGKD